MDAIEQMQNTLDELEQTLLGITEQLLTWRSPPRPTMPEKNPAHQEAMDELQLIDADIQAIVERGREWERRQAATLEPDKRRNGFMLIEGGHDG